jgi:hypothetical protein
MMHALSPSRGGSLTLTHHVSRGFSCLPQIFGGQSETGIGTGSSKGVDSHSFKAVGAKIVFGQFFLYFHIFKSHFWAFRTKIDIK